MPSVSVIVCTYNRAGLLNRTIECLTRQTLPASDYEILIIDNASTDETAQLVQQWGKQYANVRYLYEPVQGLSHARNRGAAEAQASLLAYIDDDARAYPNWLENILRAFDKVPQPAVIGGPIELEWEGGQVPKWMTQHLQYMLSYQYYGELPRTVNHLNGANFSILKSTLNSLGGFDPRLGRHGRLLLAGEETELLQIAKHNNKIILYDPEVRVKHWIAKNRQTARYMWAVFYGIGRSIRPPSNWAERFYVIRRSIIRIPGRIRQACRAEPRLNARAILMIVSCEFVYLLGVIYSVMFRAK